MDDPILNSDELTEKSTDNDDDIAYVRGDTIYKKIIPILLSPKVIFPFAAMNPIVTDPHLIRLFEEAHKGKTVIGYAYHPETAATALPKLQHVGVAAIVPEFSKLVDGSYLVKIVPLSRFFITEYINDDPNDITARVSYYYDQPEDEKAIKFLADELFKRKKEIDEAIKEYVKPKSQTDDHTDPYDPLMLTSEAYASFSCFPGFTEDEKQYLLWSYKLSERLMILIQILDESLPSVKRVAKKTRPFKNN